MEEAIRLADADAATSWFQAVEVLATLLADYPLQVPRAKVEYGLSLMRITYTVRRRCRLINAAWRWCNHDELNGAVLVHMEALVGCGRESVSSEPQS